MGQLGKPQQSFSRPYANAQILSEQEEIKEQLSQENMQAAGQINLHEQINVPVSSYVEPDPSDFQENI